MCVCEKERERERLICNLVLPLCMSILTLSLLTFHPPSLAFNTLLNPILFPINSLRGTRNNWSDIFNRPLFLSPCAVWTQRCTEGLGTCLVPDSRSGESNGMKIWGAKGPLKAHRVSFYGGQGGLLRHSSAPLSSISSPLGPLSLVDVVNVGADLILFPLSDDWETA